MSKISIFKTVFDKNAYEPKEKIDTNKIFGNMTNQIFVKHKTRPEFVELDENEIFKK